MKTLITVAALAAATLAVTGAASAQPRGNGPGQAGPSITLYDLPNYQGASRSYDRSVDNRADLGLNDRAQSARVAGRWQICQDANFRGRCTEVSGDVPNLATIGMTAAISSFQSLDRGDNYGNRGGFPADRGNAGPFPPQGGFEGRGNDNRGDYRGDNRGDNRNFAGQSLDGRGASFFPRPMPGPYRTADEFCRRLGFTGVIYADDRRGELRDVVCRR
jgi:hypothetical protein